MARIRVLLDACVLLPYQLADLLLRLADAELFEPIWSDEILTEIEKNLVEKFHVSPEKASRRLSHMRSAFPNAVVHGYEDLVAAMTNHPKDRHVAAAAVRGGAALIVTANIRDFRPESLEQYDVVAVHPDDFLQDQLELAREVTVACVQQQRAAYTQPQFTFAEFYLGLRPTVPNFARLAAAAEREGWENGDPLPLEVVPLADVRQAFFPDGPPEPTSPLGAAALWWSALLNKAEYMSGLRSLTWYPPAWGDYQEALQRLSGTGMMQFVERCPDDSEIAYIKFLPEVDHPMRAFAEAPLLHVQVLTMVRSPSDGLWRAWGLSEDRFPTSAEVRTSEREVMPISHGARRTSKMDDDIEWDTESFPLGKGTEDDPIYKEITDSFGFMLSGHRLRLATEAAGPGVITLDMRDRSGELVQLDPANAVALARRLLGAALYWIELNDIGDREQVIEVRDYLNSSLGLAWESE